MRVMRLVVLVVVLALVAVSVAGAEEKFGVTVFDGAKYDAATSEFLSKAAGVKAACYRINDNPAKITEFYRRQPGLKYVGESPTGTMFQKGSVEVTVQNPWKDMKTGKMNMDTLISIVKKKN